jgi:hypothetical protein
VVCPPVNWRAFKKFNVHVRSDDRPGTATRATHTSKAFYIDVTIDGQDLGQVGIRKKGFFGSAISTWAQSFMAYRFMNEAGVNSPRSNLARILVNGED